MPKIKPAIVNGFPTIGTGICGERKITIVNPNDRDWTRGRYVLWFGACGPTALMAYANSLDDALDECVDWIAEHAPGLLANDAVDAAYSEAVAAGKSEEEAIEEAETDITRAGNAGDCLLSWEWGIALENPTRAQLVAYLGGR